MSALLLTKEMGKLETANQITSSMAMINNADPDMTGSEWWPLIGNAVTESVAIDCIAKFKGLKRHWNCIDKAKIVSAALPDSHVALGSLMVFSRDMQSSYGYYFNPPFEFHAWVRWQHYLIDFALPGVIEKGLTVCDHLGPVLTKRNPILLAGHPPNWIKYATREILKP